MKFIVTTGLKETLTELKKYEPEALRSIKKDLLVTTQPLATVVGSHFPAVALKNWSAQKSERSKTRFPNYPSNVRSMVKPVALKGVSGKSRYGVTVLRLEQKSAGGSVYDGAGSKTASRFVKNLDKHSRVVSTKNRTRSRVMYGVTKGKLSMIEVALRTSLAKIDKLVNAHLAQYGSKF